VLRAGSNLFVVDVAPPEPSANHFGLSAAACALETTLRQLATGASAVLLLGETGAGKEVAAQAVHAWSGRQGPFVAVNAAAIPEALAESMLFGHRKGAFTGAAADSDGFFTHADQGTLFLD